MAEGRSTSRVLAGLSGLPRAFVAVPADAGEGAGASAAEVAFEQGRREGLEAGAAQAAAEFTARFDALRQEIAETLKTLVDLRNRSTREHRQAMLELALAAASRMLRDKIEQDDPVAARALEEALSALPESGPVRVRLHPDDVESVRVNLTQEIDSGQIEMTADDTLSRGGCVVESDAGSIDATAETASSLVAEAALGTDAP